MKIDDPNQIPEESTPGEEGKGEPESKKTTQLTAIATAIYKQYVSACGKRICS